MRAISDQGFTIRVPSNMFDKVLRLNSVYRDLEVEGVSKDEEYKFIKERINISEKELERQRFISQNILSITSLNINVGKLLDTELIEFVRNHKNIDAFEELASSMLKEDIEKVLTELTHREKIVITLRFGLNDNRRHTLNEIGQLCDISSERIRQIQDRGLRRLKRLKETKHLKDYIIEG